MNEFWQWIGFSVVLGVGATFLGDVWGQLVRIATGIAPLDWRLVGCWLGHMPHRFFHDNIGTAPPIPGEKVLGWSAHYATGIFLAAAMLGLFGLDWLASPDALWALAFGLATVALPFFILQPALGAGVAAQRTPNPSRARVMSVLTHCAFGLDLWVCAAIVNVLRS